MGPHRFGPIRCETCNKQFSRREHLRRHCELHRNVKPYKCSSCDRSFARKDAARRHVATHAESDRLVVTVQEETYADSQTIWPGISSPEQRAGSHRDKGIAEVEPGPAYVASFPSNDPRNFPRASSAQDAQPPSSHSTVVRDTLSGDIQHLNTNHPLFQTMRYGYPAENSHPRKSQFERSPSRPLSSSTLDSAVTEPALTSQDATFPSSEERISSHTAVIPAYPAGIVAHTSSFLARKDFSHVNSTLSESARIFMVTPVTLALLTDLYFEHFHPIYPFIDGSSLRNSLPGALLCLATAAIGACFQDSATGEDESSFLHMILHDTLMAELSKSHTAGSLHFLQAITLHTIGLLHSTRKESRQLAYSMAALTFQLSSVVGVFSPRCRNGHLDQNDAGNTAWRDAETRTRTGYFLNILDVMLAFPCNASLLLSQRSLVGLGLPNPDKAWENSPNQDVDDPRLESFTLEDALCRLYLERTLVPGQSEFALTGLIYSVIRRNLDVALYYNHPLSFWTPGDDRQWYPGYLPRRHEDTQRNEIYRRWRDSACDSLDILHWEILGRSATVGGHESPIFLQLHLARIAILAPCPELLRMFGADSEVGTSLSTLSNKEIIQNWLQLDQHKARLAVLHAGATFWHVRHADTSSFTQPLAIFLAAIVLWVYGCHEYFDGLRRQQCDVDLPTSSRSQESNIEQPDSMHVDRPFDDELAQFFIRTGQVQLYMHRVGKVCSIDGPSRVLCETKSLLLRRERIWGVSRHYIACLQDALNSSPWK